MVSRTRNETLSRALKLICIAVLLSSLFASIVYQTSRVNALADLDFQLVVPSFPNAANTTGMRATVMADFNLDGKNDLATSNSGLNTVSVWLGNGDGTMGPASVVATGSVSHWGLAAGDVNLDGKPDLVLSGATFLRQVEVLLGLGNGTFSSPQSYSAGSVTGLKGVAIADFNEDGKPDVAAAHTSGVALLKGNGDGTFQASTSFSTGGLGIYNLAVGDFNGDNHLDLAASNHDSGTIGVILGDGSGDFGLPRTYPAGGNTPNSVAAGDFDNDAVLDLAAVQEFGSVQTLEILQGMGDGTFTVQPIIPLGFIYPKSIAVADFDVDGNADLAITMGSFPSILVLRGNGDLTFDPQVSFSIDGLAPNWSSLAVGKMNGDNMADIVVANYNANLVSVLLNVGDTIPPVISASIDPAPNINSWWNVDVTITFDCIDSGSGVDTFTSPITLTDDGYGQSVQGDCADISGNTATTEVTGINVDETFPNLTGAATTAQNSNGWYSGDVTVHWDCTDDLSGLEVGSVTADTTLSSEGAGQSVAGTCSDLAGNLASQTVGGLNIDKTPPMLSPTVSPGMVPLNGSATVSANASDAISGVASQSCGTLDTSTAGTKTVSCTATDHAGNTASATASYLVSEGSGFTFSGFLQPVDNLPTVNQVNAGRGIPIKFSLGGDQGMDIFASGYPGSQQISCSSGSSIDNIETTITASGSSLSYDPFTGQYTYVWKTEKSWVGTCRQLTIVFTDGTQSSPQFKFK